MKSKRRWSNIELAELQQQLQEQQFLQDQTQDTCDASSKTFLIYTSISGSH